MAGFVARRGCVIQDYSHEKNLYFAPHQTCFSVKMKAAIVIWRQFVVYQNMVLSCNYFSLCLFVFGDIAIPTLLLLTNSRKNH